MLCCKEKENDICFEIPSKCLRSSFKSGNALGSAVCFFCDESGVFYDEENQPTDRLSKEKKSKLRKRVKTLTRDANMREAATQMGATNILAKLFECDMMAREAC